MVLSDCSDEGFIKFCYEMILGRSPDPDDLPEHVRAVELYGRAAVRRSFISSPEFAQVVARDQGLRGPIARAALANESGDLRVEHDRLSVELKPVTVPIGDAVFRVYDLPPYDATR